MPVLSARPAELGGYVNRGRGEDQTGQTLCACARANAVRRSLLPARPGAGSSAAPRSPRRLDEDEHGGNPKNRAGNKSRPAHDSALARRCFLSLKEKKRYIMNNNPQDQKSY